MGRGGGVALDILALTETLDGPREIHSIDGWVIIGTSDGIGTEICGWNMFRLESEGLRVGEGGIAGSGSALSMLHL